VDVLRPSKAAQLSRIEVFTPKALRIEELRSHGMNFSEAFAIAESEYTSDGMLLKRGTTDLSAVLSRGVAQMGEVQF
jgi:hypothetical protein